MLNIAPGETKSRVTDEAAIGRFFNARGCYDFSEAFWLVYGPQMPEGFGMVIQAGLDKAGGLVSFKSRMPYEAIVSLGIDARARSGGVYSWYVSTASTEQSGRSVCKIDVSSSDITGRKVNFDFQGRLTQSSSVELRTLETLKGFGDISRYTNDGLAILASEESRRVEVAEATSAANLSCSFEDGQTSKGITTAVGFIALLPYYPAGI